MFVIPLCWQVKYLRSTSMSHILLILFQNHVFQHYTVHFQKAVVCWDDAVNLSKTIMISYFILLSNFTCTFHSFTPDIHISYALSSSKVSNNYFAYLNLYYLKKHVGVLFFQTLCVLTSILNPMKTILSGHFAIRGSLSLWWFDEKLRVWPLGCFV